MHAPANAVAAVTHPDPYPFYAALVAERPLYRDDALWVATGADAVTAVLQSGLCRVRPPAEPVPRALLGSPAATLFRHLVRMTDGAGHCPLKRAVTSTLAGVTAERVAAAATAAAEDVATVLTADPVPRGLNEFAFRLPVHVTADLLGFVRADRPRIAEWMADFVRCLAPASEVAAIERGKEAADRLLQLGRGLLAAGAPGLLGTLASEMRRAGIQDDEAIVANAIGFLSQGYEATAGLVGNALLALAAHREVRDEVTAEPALLSPLLQEVLRYDPPVQNTRRFVAEDGVVAGRAMRSGDAILVVLAAANRDPAANPSPERFALRRDARRTFTLGGGAHACPGEALACTIAEAGVRHLLASGLDLETLAEGVTYRPSANTRIPVLGGGPR